MTTERTGRHDPHATVGFMRWAPDKGGDRLPGIRIGYGKAFCFIPEDEIMTLANALVDYIDTNNLNTNA